MPGEIDPDMVRAPRDDGLRCPAMYMSGYAEQSAIAPVLGGDDTRALLHKRSSPRALALKIRELLDGTATDGG